MGRVQLSGDTDGIAEYYSLALAAVLHPPSPSSSSTAPIGRGTEQSLSSSSCSADCPLPREWCATRSQTRICSRRGARGMRRRIAWVAAGCAVPPCVQSQSSAAAVEWRISIAADATDESCSSVCEGFGMLCTERCWPANLDAMREMMYGQYMQGVCFQVQAGLASGWNPAKDPETRICTWNPGVVSAPRCPVASVTPGDKQASGYFRRLCPCLRSRVSSTASINCGLGMYPAAPAPESVTSPPAPVPRPTPAPTRPPSSLTSGVLDGNASHVPTPSPTKPPTAYVRPSCTLLCVSGFGGADQGLNGQYARVAYDGGFKRWSKPGDNGATIGLAKAEGGANWEFSEIRSSVSSFSVAQGAATPDVSDMPADETFITATDEYSVQFGCCVSSSSSGGNAGYGGSGSAASLVSTTGATEDDGGFAILLAILVIVVCLAIIAGVAYYFLRRRTNQRRVSKLGLYEAEPDAKSGFVGHPVETAQRGGKWAQRQPGWADGGGAGDELEAATCPGGFFSHEDNAADGIADMLGRAAPKEATLGLYEGPVRPWWGAGKKPAADTIRGATTIGFTGARTIPAEPSLRLGTEVRLRNMNDQPLWNDTEGFVVGFEEGLVQIELDDGRTKAVLAEQCEVISTPRAEPEGEELGIRQARSSQHRPSWRAPPPSKVYGTPGGQVGHAPEKWRRSPKAQPTTPMPPRLTKENLARHEASLDSSPRGSGSVNTGPPRTVLQKDSAHAPIPPPPPLPATVPPQADPPTGARSTFNSSTPGGVAAPGSRGGHGDGGAGGMPAQFRRPALMDLRDGGYEDAGAPRPLASGAPPLATPTKLPGAPASPVAGNAAGRRSLHGDSARSPLRETATASPGLPAPSRLPGAAAVAADGAAPGKPGGDEGLAAAAGKMSLTPNPRQAAASEHRTVAGELQQALRSNAMQLDALKARLAQSH